MKRILSLFLLLNTLSIHAQITFQNAIGGTGNDNGYSVQQTTDGGYIITGYTLSFGAGNSDFYLIKTDANGNSVWTKTFGGTGLDEARSVQQTGGGYIITGRTLSFGAGLNDVYIIKTDASGNSQWTKTFGGATDDEGRCVKRTADGGYIIAGFTQSFGVGFDFYLIKIDANGNTVWTRTLGVTTSGDAALFIQQTTDGGYIICGYANGIGAGGNDVYLIKTDVIGNSLWAKTFGGTGSDVGYSIQQTTDGGYIITGNTYSFGAGNSDVYLIKTDANGDSLWTKTFGGTGFDGGLSILQTTDGGYIITGPTESFGAGNNDVYLIKTDGNGDTLWSKTFGGTGQDLGYSVQQTSDGGYIITGYTESFVDNDVYLIKTDSNGNSGCNQGNPATIVTTPATQVSSSTTNVSFGATITNPATIVSSGGVVTPICIPTVMNETQQDENTIFSFPNPTTTEVTISFGNTAHRLNGGLDVRLCNTLGEQLKHLTLNSSPSGNGFSVSIDVSKLAPGIYFVTVTDENKNSLTRKMVKM